MFFILISDPISESCIHLLKNSGFYVIYKPNISKKELIEEIKNKHAIILRGRTKLDKEVLGNANELKLIVRAGVGLDNIDVNYAESKGIKVFNTPGANANAVAELTVCLILALLRGVNRGDMALKKGEWIKDLLVGRELKGKTVGILGFGRIGYEVAKKLRCFDCKIIAYSRSDKSERAKELGIEFTRNLDELLSSCDIITIHLPLTSETYKFMNKERIMKMKKGSYLINTSRGAIIDESALIEALEKGHIAGAALDVFEQEPPLSDLERRLISMNNVITTPHIAGQSIEALENESIEAARIIINFFSNLKYK